MVNHLFRDARFEVCQIGYLDHSPRAGRFWLEQQIGGSRNGNYGRGSTAEQVDEYRIEFPAGWLLLRLVLEHELKKRVDL
jgi:hypothetical protein